MTIILGFVKDFVLACISKQVLFDVTFLLLRACARKTETTLDDELLDIFEKKFRSK